MAAGQMRLKLFLVFFLVINTVLGQYRLYEEGIKKYNEKDYYTAIELFSDFLTKPLHDKKFDADTYYWRGLSAFKLNDFEAASEDLKQSLTLKHPNNGNIRWFLAKSLAKLNQYEASAVEYGDAIKIFDKDKNKKAQLLAERAQLYLKLDKGGAALQDLQVASSIDPNNESIKEELEKLASGQSRNASVIPDNQKKADESKKDIKTQAVVQKQEEKKTPVIEKKEEKKDAIAKNKTEPQPQPVVLLPVIVSVQPATIEQKEPTLAELYIDEKKYALVIGNSAYPKEIGVLKNPVNDATDFADAIKKLGFDVTLITNASYGKTRAEMMKFRDKLNLGERDKTVGLFYYAGHGLQNDNENYIVPVDAELQYQDDIARYCFPIQKMVLTQMENTNSRMNIVILDACRNNPFPALHRGIGEAQGLGELKKARGAFIAYATSPGSVASDGTGRNGLYTQELIKAMNKPGRTIEQVFKEVRASVLKQSGDRQNPWENSNIIGDFYFKFD